MKNLLLFIFLSLSTITFGQKPQTIKFSVIEGTTIIIKERLKTLKEVTEKLSKTNYTFESKEVYANVKGNLFVVWIEGENIFKKSLPKTN